MPPVVADYATTGSVFSRTFRGECDQSSRPTTIPILARAKVSSASIGVRWVGSLAGNPYLNNPSLKPDSSAVLSAPDPSEAPEGECLLSRNAAAAPVFCRRATPVEIPLAFASVIWGFHAIISP